MKNTLYDSRCEYVDIEKLKWSNGIHISDLAKAAKNTIIIMNNKGDFTYKDCYKDIRLLVAEVLKSRPCNICLKHTCNRGSACKVFIEYENKEAAEQKKIQDIAKRVMNGFFQEPSWSKNIHNKDLDKKISDKINEYNIIHKTKFDNFPNLVKFIKEKIIDIRQFNHLNYGH